MLSKLITKPSFPAVELDDIKAHLRIDSGDSDHDIRLAPYLNSAVDQAQDYTSRALITQTWDIVFQTWNELSETILPFGKLQSVTSLKYQDEDGATHTVSSDDYLVDKIGTDEGKIIFHSDSDFEYPALWESDPITVRIVCGYGDAASDVPASIQSAIKLMVEEMDMGEDFQTAIDRLLNSSRLRPM